MMWHRPILTEVNPRLRLLSPGREHSLSNEIVDNNYIIQRYSMHHVQSQEHTLTKFSTEYLQELFGAGNVVMHCL